MESTMRKYAGRIASNEVDPLRRADDGTDGLLLDPGRDEVPLDLLGFGIYRIEPERRTLETGDQEMVLVPQEGEFEAEIGGKRFSGSRWGGPFVPGPGKTNASALYAPRGEKILLRGRGEMACFTAPARGDKPPAHVAGEAVQVVSRGEWGWRRDIVSLVSPENASTNLVVGETCSPPGYWSGMPLHRHDRDAPSSGESDHEEVYYHRFPWRRNREDRFGPFGVQLLMDGERLMKAYLIQDRTAVAIPGGCHPVVASPVSALLYLWALAGRGGALAMRDIPEFACLKSLERIFREIGEGAPARSLSKDAFAGLCRDHALTKRQADLLAWILKEKGVACP